MLETAHLGPGELSQAPPGIPKGVSCVLTHLSRALSVSRFVQSWYISGEPEVLSGTSCTWVSKEKSESNLTLSLVTESALFSGEQLGTCPLSLEFYSVSRDI